MRSRNIKPGFFDNELLGECSFEARILFTGLWCLADREGRLERREKKIKAKIFPFDDQIVIKKLLDELEARKFIETYAAEDIVVIQVVNFLKHQNPHQNEKTSYLGAKPFAPRTKALSEMHQSTPADSCILIPDPCSLIPDPCSLIPEENIKHMSESKNDSDKNIYSNEKNKTKFVKPNLSEVKTYCKERNNQINPEAFIDFYTSKDWMIGRNRMKDWKAAIRTWERSNKTDDQYETVNCI